MTLRLSATEGLLVEVAGGTRSPSLLVEPGTPGWKELLTEARWHRLVPQLWEHLQRADGPEPPPRVAAWLRDAVRATTARNLALAFERDRVLAALDRAGIPVVLLKGAALLEMVYDHPGMRPMVDLDLLVRAEQLQEAHALTEGELGFTVQGARLVRDDAERIASSHHHFPLTRRDGAVMVELHHRLLADRPEYEATLLWERSRPVDGPPPHRLPDPGDLLLHLAAHFAFDRANRGDCSLGQLADVVRVARRYDIDWDQVVEQARTAAVADRLFLGLWSANRLFGEVVPPGVVRELEPASYTPALGERFVRQRVLAAQPAFPLEQLSGGRRRIFPGVGALESYVRADDVHVPGRATLHARRWAALARRAAHGASRPVELARDVRLSRWILSLRG